MDTFLVKKSLEKNFGFSNKKIDKISKYVDLLLIFNKKYNLISKSTEKEVWSRHILDSAQIIKYIDFKKDHILSDFGSGAGLPGVIISIANTNPNFHVKLYEKSPVKRSFLNDIQKISKFDIEKNVYDYNLIKTDYIVCRAFKKLDLILDISREKVKNPHKLIILKGKNALNDLKKLPKDQKYSYKTEDSVTDKDSKIIIATKNGK
jgi:16S rRNA (guanine527-N7)-methyltransferase